MVEDLFAKNYKQPEREREREWERYPVLNQLFPFDHFRLLAWNYRMLKIV
jgi:hypothetical protein